MAKVGIRETRALREAIAAALSYLTDVDRELRESGFSPSDALPVAIRRVKAVVWKLQLELMDQRAHRRRKSAGGPISASAR